MNEHRFTAHALGEMERRGITRTIAERVLEMPEQRVGADNGRTVYQSRIADAAGKIYLFRLIVDRNETPFVVVTVYRTSKIDKYWRIDEGDL